MNLIKYFRNYLFLMVLVLLTGMFLIPLKTKSQPVYNNFKPVKMVFLPDTHISFKECDDWILYKESFVIFQDTIKNLKNTSGIDFVVFGGDLIDNEDNQLGDLSLFLDSIDDVPFKYYTILGDREADLKDGYTKQDFCVEFRRNGFDNPELTYWAQQPSENVLLIGLDASVENKFEGKLPSEELLWLDNVLKANPGKFTIITMHHPAIQTADADKTAWKKFILANSDEFINLINKYPQVKLILSGHHHNYAVTNINRKLFISLPSIATYPNQYKILTIYPDRVEIENKNISFKQIIKKSGNLLVKTQYAEDFDSKKPKNILKFQEGAEFKRNRVYYFQK